MPDRGERRIHLDFHTSPAIMNVAEDFDAKEFAKTLKEANVDSVTIFAKCVYGMCYYPTRIGKMHPGLKIDLMGKMMEVCSKVKISTPLYLSAVWDDYAASLHQEWVQITKGGKLGGRHPLRTNKWREVCLNTAYVDYFMALIEEILDGYAVDGFFIDMVKQGIARMESKDLINWRLLPPIFISSLSQCELPEYFCLGEKHYLIFCSCKAPFR